VKKISSILLIALLISLQYAKQINYIGCEIYNMNTNVDCGCDKILTTSTENSDATSTTTIHRHFHVDDYVNRFSQNLTIKITYNENKKIHFLYDTSLCSGVKSGLFRPPSI
jgi:hypothetical protein